MQPPAYSSISDKKIDKISLRGAALPDPDHPFLISPLPQFTTPLTTSNNFTFTPVPPLPELSDDLEDDEDDEETNSEPQHEATTPIVVQQDLRGSNGIRRLSFLQTDGRSEHDSALARSGPYLDHRRARSGSSPETYSSPSSSVNDTSNAPPRSPLKSATLSQSQQIQQHAPSSSRGEGDASFPTRSALARNPDGGVLRTRLHDLLRDSAMSSSLPNMSASYFPTSFTNRETSSGRVSPLPPRSDSSNTNRTPLSSSSSDTSVSLPQTGTGKPLTGAAPYCNFAPRQGFSSASTEAKKLEEERKRKLKEEKQQQSSRLENANEMDHMSSKQPSTSTFTQASNNTTPIQLTPRREQQSSIITNSGPIPPSARRGQSFTGSLGRSGSIVSPSKEEQHDSVSNSGPPSASSSTRRGQSYTGSLGRSGTSSSSTVSPSKEEQYQQQQHDSFTHQSRYVSSIGKARGGILSSTSSVDPAGIYV